MTRYDIRPIASTDNPAVATLIRTVMPEFGACGPGFAINDAEVDSMFESYSREGHAYFVLEQDGRLVGGGGVGRLPGADGVCELRKMYFYKEARGTGQGERMLRHCLDAARSLGYRVCYLETLGTMTAAMKLYEKLGFKKRAGALGDTGHFSCDRFYELDL